VPSSGHIYATLPIRVGDSTTSTAYSILYRDGGLALYSATNPYIHLYADG